MRRTTTHDGRTGFTEEVMFKIKTSKSKGLLSRQLDKVESTKHGQCGGWGDGVGAG